MKGNGGGGLMKLWGHAPPEKFLKFRVLLVHSGVVLVLLN